MSLKYLWSYLRPKNAHHAGKLRSYLAVIYAITGWNAAIFIFLKMYNKNLPEDPEERKAYLASKLSRDQPYTLIRVEKFTVVENSRRNEKETGLTKENKDLSTT